MALREATSMRRLARCAWCCILGGVSLLAGAQQRSFSAAVVAPGHEAAGITQVAPEEKTIHLLVGRSLFINSIHRLARVYVTNPAVLSAYIASPNQILVTSKDAGVSSLVVWDETGANQPYFFSSDLDINRLRASFQESMPDEDIHVEGDGGRIVLSGIASDPTVSDAAVKLAGMYSKDVFNALVVNSSHVKQVRLKVRIVEVDRSKLQQFGFNFFSAGGNNLAQTSTTQFPSSLTVTAGGGSGGSSSSSSSVGGKSVTVGDPLNFLIFNSALNIGATLQDLQTKQILQILAEPNITTISGKEASFLSGGEFPFPVVQGSAGGLTSISIQFRPYGVKIDFTPEVNIDGTIQLKVAPEVSALDYTNAVSIDGYEIPALSTRRASTQVVLKSGQSFAISGLLDRRITDAYSKTPGIASVPILGQLFKSKSLNHSTTELVVIVTPDVVDPLTEDQPIHEPKVPVPALDSKTFDNALPKQKPEN
ncbi:pilus assembly protein CpaC [Silvibacterium bohemicum]|uniref:Pilus assembly protein CpaC n=1 Tax=Silvibacterium bohemicum TaxID=1577686 RepID=A0A841JXC1_9BACT|nr:type II and III secretion system protein family protein [Silvibacterium bohemicum]MBB6142644.1 pilus assembly protein CpaC [Silvibacterium bohemicum]